MKWINEVLERPAHERPFLLIPVGRAAAGATVPAIARKPLDEVLVELGPARAGAPRNDDAARLG